MASYKYDQEHPRKVRLMNVRLSYPHFFEKRKEADDDGKIVERGYSGMFILDKKEHADALKFIEETLIPKACTEKWGEEKGKKFAPALVKSGDVFLRDGDEKIDDNGDVPVELQGKMFFNASSYTAKPTVLDRSRGPDGKPVRLTAEDGRPYAGCYVNVIIEAYGQDPKKERTRRVNAGLTGVQFWADGEPLSGGKAADEDEFDYAEADDSASDIAFV